MHLQVQQAPGKDGQLVTVWESSLYHVEDLPLKLRRRMPDDYHYFSQQARARR